jgi:hypothetical protein
VAKTKASSSSMASVCLLLLCWPCMLPVEHTVAESCTQFERLPTTWPRCRLQGLVVFLIDGQHWTLDLREGAGTVLQGPPIDKPDLTLTISDENFAKMVMGKLSPQQVRLQRAGQCSAEAASKPPSTLTHAYRVMEPVCCSVESALYLAPQPDGRPWLVTRTVLWVLLGPLTWCGFSCALIITIQSPVISSRGAAGQVSVS